MIRDAGTAQPNGLLPNVVLVDVTVTFSIGGTPLVVTYTRAIEALGTVDFGGGIRYSRDGVLSELRHPKVQ